MEAITKFCFFHLVRLTIFDAALAYFELRHTCKIYWCSVPSSCHPLVLTYHWRRATVSGRLAIDGGVKRCEDGTKHCVSNKEGARVTWHAVNYETVKRATLLAREYFDSTDGRNAIKMWRMSGISKKMEKVN